MSTEFFFEGADFIGSPYLVDIIFISDGSFGPSLDFGTNFISDSQTFQTLLQVGQLPDWPLHIVVLVVFIQKFPFAFLGDVVFHFYLNSYVNFFLGLLRREIVRL